MFWFFSRKKGVDALKEDTKKSFDSVKKDISAVSGWIKHLDSERDIHKREIEDLKEDLSSIKEEVVGIKNVIEIMNNLKTNSRLINKQPF